MESGMKIVRGIEGTKLTIVCTVESGRPATTLVLSLKEFSVLREGEDRITYSFIPTRKDNMQSIVCSAKSTLLDNPLSLEVQLDIQYSPVVKITSRPTNNKLVLLCNPSGNPASFSFGDWEHWSEFKEHIRNLKGTSEGSLILLKSNNNTELHELDGIYKCKASNGIYDTTGQLYQTGTALVHNKVPPIFVNANKPIQIGRYGQKMNITVLLYNKYDTIQTAISKLNKPLYTKTNQESIWTQDIFHDVNVTVSGVKITFQLTLVKTEDFTDYTIKACNKMGCNELLVKIISENSPETPTNVSVIPFERHIAVSWSPGYNGGFQQTFFVEYQAEDEDVWSRSGPVSANRGRSCTYINRGMASSVNNCPDPSQICELNYIDITFNEASTMRDDFIHGRVDRTIYSEIDIMAAPVAPLSRSESECDESDI
ncbi:protein turtle-like [Mytilus trossulus]|uniref:protein turtle-like n=1 Tax=Mytilus trossulus TaxID=6551 RepID=UPI003004836B